jgi:two-component system, response regulator YesN
MQPGVQRIIDQLNRDLRRKLTLADLAQVVGHSRSLLCRVFKEETGLTVKQYLKKLRMKKACELLQGTSLIIKEICAAVGMRDQSHFTRDFKKIHGLTPTEYRRLHYTAESENKSTRTIGH